LNFYNRIWENVWAAYYEAGKILGVQYDLEKYKLYQQWNKLCPIWMWDDKAVYILSRPKSISWKGNMLHNENGPSVDYAEHFRLWHIDNILVDEQIVLAPETQTIKQIEEEKNQDKKAIRIERYGWPKFLQEVNAQCIDSRYNEVEGTQEALYVYGNVRKMVATCPTGRIFTMGVPPEVENCEQAAHYLKGPVKFNLITRT